MRKQLYYLIFLLSVWACKEKVVHSEAKEKLPQTSIETEPETMLQQENQLEEKNDTKDQVLLLPKLPPLNNLEIPEDSVIEGLGQNSEFIASLGIRLDSVEAKLTREEDTTIELYAELHDSSIVKIHNKEWPENPAFSYNILRNSTEKISFFAIYPFVESGDWSLCYQYYFDSEGNTVAFKRESKFWGGECIPEAVRGAVSEQSVYFFDSSFQLIRKTFGLKDQEGNDLREKVCFSPGHHEYQISPNVESLGIDWALEIENNDE